MPKPHAQGVLQAAFAAFLSILAFAGSTGESFAATYYVDRDQGSDNYSGQAAAADRSAGTGPWRTLAKVSSSPSSLAIKCCCAAGSHGGKR